MYVLVKLLHVDYQQSICVRKHGDGTRMFPDDHKPRYTKEGRQAGFNSGSCIRDVDIGEDDGTCGITLDEEPRSISAAVAGFRQRSVITAVMILFHLLLHLER